jgi:protein phosphatase
VADGMGGQLAGEKASQMAVELIPREVSRRIGADDGESDTQRALRDAVAKANDEILALSHVGPEYANMGTTVVLAHFRGTAPTSPASATRAPTGSGATGSCS